MFIRQIVQQKCNLKQYLHASTQTSYFRIPSTYIPNIPAMYYIPFYIFIRTNHEPRHRGAIVDNSPHNVI